MTWAKKYVKKKKNNIVLFFFFFTLPAGLQKIGTPSIWLTILTELIVSRSSKKKSSSRLSLTVDTKDQQ